MVVAPYRLQLLLCSLPLLGWSASTHAQDAYGARASVRQVQLAATHNEDATAAGSSVDLVDRISLPRSLGEALREAPGVIVQRTGGVGAFQALSIRGGDGEETTVMVDEIPISSADGGAFDLSLFPTELFERADVFRGGSPVWLGSGAIGGVLRLVPRRDLRQSGRVSAAAGSFGLWQLAGGATAGSDAQIAVRSQVVLRKARNDYPYADDRGTLLDPTDDVEMRRKNAQLTESSGFLDLTVPVLGGRLHVLMLAQERVGGYPGHAATPSPTVRRTTLRTLLAASYERRKGGSTRAPKRRLQVVASTAYNRDTFWDPFAQIGLSNPTDANDKTYRSFLRAAGNVRLARWLEGTLLGSYTFEGNDRYNSFAFPNPADSTRHSAMAAIELAARGRLGPIGLELRPAARMEWSYARLHSNRTNYETFDATRNVTAPTVRLGFGAELYDDVALSASVATGTRLPTMFELFGNRGQVNPAPQLEPVKSVTYDAGLTWRTTRQHWSTASEARAFLQARRDMIVSTRNAQGLWVNENQAKVEQRGFELGLNGTLLDVFSLHAALTYLDTQNLGLQKLVATNPPRYEALDLRLPQRPAWVMFARPELVFRIARGPVSAVAASAELYSRSFVFSDIANLAVTRACQTVGASASVRFLRDRITLLGRMDDAGDARCMDLTGYPLTGRTLFFSLSYQEAKS